MCCFTYFVCLQRFVIVVATTLLKLLVVCIYLHKAHPINAVAPRQTFVASTI